MSENPGSQQEETPAEFLERFKNEMRQISDNTQIKVDFLRSLEREGFDQNNKEDVAGLGGAIAGELNQLFADRYNLAVPQEKLPIVITANTDIERKIIGTTDVPFSTRVVLPDGKHIDMLHMRNLNDILNGNYFSEEMAHFYRSYFGPEEKHEEITGEFFGFIGKRLWQKAANSGVGDLKYLVDYEEQEVRDPKVVLGESKEIKKRIKELPEGDALIKRMEDTRRNSLVHQRGYEWASKLDIDKIHDWEKLFSMPNAEVRKRFFTNEQDYSGL